MGTASTILLISDGALVAVVALVAIVVVSLVVLGVVFMRPPTVQSGPAPAAPAAAPVAAPVAAPPPIVRAPVARALGTGRTMEIDVPTKHVDEFMSALRASGWRVHETGEVVATDDDEEALTTILVDVPRVPNPTASGEEIR